jgi:hypothetical protein
MDYKERVRAAIEKFTMKQDKKDKGPTRKNSKPEKELEKEVLALLRSWGWSVAVVESKSTYDPRAGRYISQSIKQGFSDLVGNTDQGLSIYIELKAPRRRSTLRLKQREFLVEKINSGCFAVCIDSTRMLEDVWNNFNRDIGHGNRRSYLLSCLPALKQDTDSDDLGFDLE